ncbi:MAG TPA: hypothetical protein VLF68_00150 [Candidatus Saccharimonadales bacterium]|nr:hypothetical protein [Candidatus Saccharimonadales bacterium]
MAEEEKKSYGYGKRPLWQWIVIYLIIGAIVYGAIYYFFLSKRGGYSAPSSSSSTQQQSAPGY